MREYTTAISEVFDLTSFTQALENLHKYSIQINHDLVTAGEAFAQYTKDAGKILSSKAKLLAQTLKVSRRQARKIVDTVFGAYEQRIKRLVSAIDREINNISRKIEQITALSSRTGRPLQYSGLVQSLQAQIRYLERLKTSIGPAFTLEGPEALTRTEARLNAIRGQVSSLAREFGLVDRGVSKLERDIRRAAIEAERLREKITFAPPGPKRYVFERISANLKKYSSEVKKEFKEIEEAYQKGALSFEEFSRKQAAIYRKLAVLERQKVAFRRTKTIEDIIQADIRERERAYAREMQERERRERELARARERELREQQRRERELARIREREKREQLRRERELARARERELREQQRRERELARAKEREVRELQRRVAATVSQIDRQIGAVTSRLSKLAFLERQGMPVAGRREQYTKVLAQLERLRAQVQRALTTGDTRVFTAAEARLNRLRGVISAIDTSFRTVSTGVERFGIAIKRAVSSADDLKRRIEYVGGTKQITAFRRIINNIKRWKQEIRIAQSEINAALKRGEISLNEYYERQREITRKINALKKQEIAFEKAKLRELDRIRGTYLSKIARGLESHPFSPHELAKPAEILTTSFFMAPMRTIRGYFREVRRVAREEGANAGVVFIRSFGQYAKQQFGRAVGAWLGAALTSFGLIYAGIETVRKFSQAYDELSKSAAYVQSATYEVGRGFVDLKTIMKDIIDISIRTGKSFTEVGNAMWELKSAGFSMKEAVEGAKAALKFSELAGENINIAETTRILAGVYRIFGNELKGISDTYDKFATLLGKTTFILNQSQIGFNELVRSFEYFAGTAKTANLNLNQTLAIVSVLSDERLPGVGRAARQAVNQIAQAIPEIASRYGIVIDYTRDLGSQLFQLIGELNKRFHEGTLSAAELSFWLKEAGIRGGPAILALARNYDVLTQRTEALSNSLKAVGMSWSEFFDVVAARRMSYFERRWQRLANAIKAAGAEAISWWKRLLVDLSDLFMRVWERWHEEAERAREEVEEVSRAYWEGLYGKERAQWLRSVPRLVSSVSTIQKALRDLGYRGQLEETSWFTYPIRLFQDFVGNVVEVFEGVDYKWYIEKTKEVFTEYNKQIRAVVASTGLAADQQKRLIGELKALGYVITDVDKAAVRWGIDIATGNTTAATLAENLNVLYGKALATIARWGKEAGVTFDELNKSARDTSLNIKSLIKDIGNSFDILESGLGARRGFPSSIEKIKDTWASVSKNLANVVGGLVRLQRVQDEVNDLVKEGIKDETQLNELLKKRYGIEKDVAGAALSLEKDVFQFTRALASQVRLANQYLSDQDRAYDKTTREVIKLVQAHINLNHVYDILSKTYKSIIDDTSNLEKALKDNREELKKLGIPEKWLKDVETFRKHIEELLRLFRKAKSEDLLKQKLEFKVEDFRKEVEDQINDRLRKRIIGLIQDAKKYGVEYNKELEKTFGITREIYSTGTIWAAIQEEIYRIDEKIKEEDKEILRIQQELNSLDKEKEKNRYKELEAAKKVHEERKKILEDEKKKLQEQAPEVAVLEKAVEAHREFARAIESIWDQTYSRLADIVADWIYEMHISFDSVLDLFRRMVSQMIATWIMGQVRMQFNIGAPGGGAQGVQPPANFVPGGNALGAWALFGGLKAGLGNFFYLPGDIMTRIGLATNWNWPFKTAGFFYAHPWAGAGLMSGLTTYLFTKDWKRALGSGVGSAGGWAIGAQFGSWGGPIGAAIGGLVGSFLGGLFGGGRPDPRAYYYIRPSISYAIGRGFQVSFLPTSLHYPGEYPGSHYETYEGMSTEVGQQIMQQAEEAAKIPAELLGELYDTVIKPLPENMRAQLDKELANIKFDYMLLRERTHGEDQLYLKAYPFQWWIRDSLLAYQEAFDDAFAYEIKELSREYEVVKPYLRDDIKEWLIKQAEALFPADIFEKLKEVPINEDMKLEDLDKWLEENIRPLFDSIEAWQEFYQWAMDYFENVQNIINDINEGLRVTTSFGSEILQIGRDVLQWADQLYQQGIDLSTITDQIIDVTQTRFRVTLAQRFPESYNYSELVLNYTMRHLQPVLEYYGVDPQQIQEMIHDGVYKPFLDIIWNLEDNLDWLQGASQATGIPLEELIADIATLGDVAKETSWKTAEAADYLQSEWDKVLFGLRHADFGSTFMQMLNDEIEKATQKGVKPDLYKVSKEWNLAIRDTIKSQILDQAFANIMAGAQEYLLDYIAKMFAGNFTLENIDQALKTINSFDFTQFTRLMTEIFASWQMGKSIDWEDLREKYGDVIGSVEQWVQGSDKTKDAAELQVEAASSLQNASKLLADASVAIISALSGGKAVSKVAVENGLSDLQPLAQATAAAVTPNLIGNLPTTVIEEVVGSDELREAANVLLSVAKTLSKAADSLGENVVINVHVDTAATAPEVSA